MPPGFVGAAQNFDFALFCAVKTVHAAASVNIQELLVATLVTSYYISGLGNILCWRFYFSVVQI